MAALEFREDFLGRRRKIQDNCIQTQPGPGYLVLCTALHRTVAELEEDFLVRPGEMIILTRWMLLRCVRTAGNCQGVVAAEML